MQQFSMFDDNCEYDVFVSKFKPKKTTDDCYTPPIVFDAVKNWVIDEYGLNDVKIVRPFYPGGDYITFEYPENCVVIDNPPFSILSDIVTFYLNKGIRFFLFSPTLTAFSSKKTAKNVNHIIVDCKITYENGAVVPTSFVTNLGLENKIIAQTCPQLSRLVNAAAEKCRDRGKSLPKYDYPDNVITAAMLQKYDRYGVEIKISTDDCIPISALDAQRSMGKTTFGSGLLLSERAAAEKAVAERAAAEKAVAERAAAERAAAERAAAIKFELSDREKEIVRTLGIHNTN